MREAIEYCARPENLRKTIRIALVVGIVLCAINQGDVILKGHATAETWLKCGLSFVVPFVVSNLGLLAGPRPAAKPASDGENSDDSPGEGIRPPPGSVEEG